MKENARSVQFGYNLGLKYNFRYKLHRRPLRREFDVPTPRFPPFRFDPVSGELWCGSEQVPLRPKTRAVLHYLLSHRGRVVTREELRQAVWSTSHGAEHGM